MLNLTTQNYCGQAKKLFAIVFMALLLPLHLFSQESTLDNTSGLWLEDAIWTDGTSPGVSSIASDVHIYGNVVSGTDIDFTAGNLYIHDTLTIFGDLTLGDTLDLTIDPAGILIVRGDFTSGDTVDVWTSGQMVVTGTFTILGDNDQGSFDNDGVLYVFDAAPVLKSGTGYGDFTCAFPVDSCSLYDESDLLASGLASFYLSGSYSIGISGPTTFCLGDSVVLSVTDTATSYQWFMDDAEIAGETSYSYAAKASGDYHVTFFVGTDSLVMDKVTVVVNALPVVTAIGLAADYCEGGEADTLAGNPLGGFFVASPDLTILGVGDSAEFDPVLAGSYEFKYYYTDGNGCTDTATVSTIVNPPPVATVTGLSASYCEGADTDTLVGGPADGFFLPGPGITILGGDSAIFDPALAGAYEFKYYYTDGNGCTDTATVATLVNTLPVVTVSGLAADYCEGGAADTLAGNPIGGFFIATPDLTILGVGDCAEFDPVLAGSYEFKYYYHRRQWLYRHSDGCDDCESPSRSNGDRSFCSYCEGADTDTLVGGPADGFFLPGPGITILGGDSAIFDPALAGAYEFKYYYTDGNGCTDTATVATLVNTLPVVTVSGLAADYCEGGEADTLAGNPIGGFFVASPDLTILGVGDSAEFDPVLAGALRV